LGFGSHFKNRVYLRPFETVEEAIEQIENWGWDYIK